jgi:hypothetical protein
VRQQIDKCLERMKGAGQVEFDALNRVYCEMLDLPAVDDGLDNGRAEPVSEDMLARSYLAAWGYVPAVPVSSATARSRPAYATLAQLICSHMAWITSRKGNAELTQLICHAYQRILGSQPSVTELRYWKAEMRAMPHAYTYPLLGRYLRDMRDAQRSTGIYRFVSHRAKQRTVLACAREAGARVLIETGTYLGEMVAALRSAFDAIYSIELSADLHRRAVQRFADSPHVCLLKAFR